LHMVQLMPLPPIISCFIKIQNGSAFLVQAYPGCPGKRPLTHINACTHARTRTHTQSFYCSSGICPGLPGWAGTRKV